jgi:hypothetical protein
MKKSIFIFVTALLFGFNANSQIALEAHFSGGASTIQGFYGNNHDLPDALYMASYQLGGAIRFPADDNFEFVVGLCYGTKGTRYRLEFPTTSKMHRLTITYFEVPIRGRLLIPYRENEGFLLNYGVYGSYYTRATQEISRSGLFGPNYEFVSDAMIGENPETDVLRPYDVGSTFGFGYYFKNFQVSIDLQIGLINILAGGASADGAKHRMISLTLAQRISPNEN